MLVSIVARFQEKRDREADHYAAWTSALSRLRNDFETSINIKIKQLRDYMEFISDDQHFDVLQDLIAEHLKLTWRNQKGELLETYIEDYEKDFVRLGSTKPPPIDLIEDEFLARYQSPHGDFPALKEYELRFPDRSDVIQRLQKRFIADGRYVKLKKLGQGAMSEVWQAYDCCAQIPLAIKEVKHNSPDKETILRHFTTEAEITARLTHPSIVVLKPLEQKNKSIPSSYGMQLVEGKPYAQLIASFHNPTIHQSKKACNQLMSRLLQMFHEICDSLAYAHEQGVLHCDLKPGNILIDQNEKPQVIDWGMAKLVTDTTSTLDSAPSLIAGTPEYMSPEQAKGFTDIRSDVFSLGAMLYEILTGSPPRSWNGTSPPADWVQQVRKSHIDAPSKMNRATPAALNAICTKALKQNPNERYQTAAELAQDLGNYLSDRSLSVWNESLPSKIWRKLRMR